MIDDVFGSADVITCPEVLGVRLRPLSIWHVWTLKTIDSPLVVGGKYDLEDVCKAVMICALTRAEYYDMARHQDALTAYYGTIAAAYIELDTEAREHVLSELGTYIDECTVFPEFWEGEGVDDVRDRIRCPVEWHLVLSLLKNGICHTEEDAWNYPISRAQCWQAVVGEMQGSKAYMDAVDREDIKKLDEVSNGDTAE